MKTILQKYIAEAGLCSRRQAEELIRTKKVLVNNKTAELGMRVDGNDQVKVYDEVLQKKEKKIYIALNKPLDYTCTNREFKNEKNIFELIDIKEKLFTVGRLDKNSHGLILLTNDGDWAQKLSHPRYEHKKIYIVKIQKPEMSEKNILINFKRGVDIGEGDGVVKAKDIKVVADNEFEITLTQGKKRQLRRMFGALNCRVKDLKRTEFADFRLGDLKEGNWENIKSI